MNSVILILCLIAGLGAGAFYLINNPVKGMSVESAEYITTNYIANENLQHLNDDELTASFVTYVRSLHAAFVDSYQADPESQLTKSLWWILDENVPSLLVHLNFGNAKTFKLSLEEEYIPQLREIQAATKAGLVDAANTAAVRDFNHRDADAFTL